MSTYEPSDRVATRKLTVLLGPLQAEVMRCFWTQGAATVREIQHQLTRDTPLAYSTILTSCLRLLEKGLLERRRVTDADQTSRPRSAYVYAPRLSEEAFTQAALAPQLDPQLTHYSAFVRAQLAGTPRQRASQHNGPERADVERLLAYLSTLRDMQGQPIDDAALDTIAALLERAEAAAQEAVALEAQVYRAAQWVEAAAARTLAAEQRAAAAARQPMLAVRSLTTLFPSCSRRYHGRREC
jgi:predicted transcriptional regulator